MDHSAAGSSTSRTRRSRGSPPSERASSASGSPGEPGLGLGALKDLAARHGVAPSRTLGQNFLADPNLARAIVADAGVGAGDQVLEVGAGLGSLSVVLAGAGAHVLAIEFDRGLIPALREVTEGLPPAAPGEPAVEVVHGDAMRIDWPGVLGGGRWKMVSNLPYNIATPLIVEMLAADPPIDSYLVMVQREVGERLAAGPGQAGYGAVSLRVAYRARARVVRRVAASVFWPRPRVDSVLVALEPLAEAPVSADPAVLFRLVDEGFAQRRKTMANALRRLGLSASAATAALGKCGIAERARAEELALADFAQLADAGVVPDA